ncbi:MAG: pyrroline-5-carboxylate reductase [Pseudomonadota bacterium]
MTATVLLVGCGNMGRAMLKGWRDARPDLGYHVVEPSDELRAEAAALGAEVAASANDLPASLTPDLIFLAVKPQIMTDVLPDYAGYRGVTFVSIAAGTTVETLKSRLGADAPIIRCMPNTPAAIGAGMMVCCATEEVAADAKALTSELLAASGVVDWIEGEALMDAVTAVSGSGPAYVFHFIEALTDAAVTAGLPRDLAGKMALQTIMGAGRLAAESGVDPSTLREQVTSPGGTTAAGLSVLRETGRLGALLTETVEAARARGEELGKV